MEKRILEIEKALQKCLKCNFYRWRLCGAYFDVEVPECVNSNAKFPQENN